MKKILFINKSQFGYHTDYTKYCEYLKPYYNITYLCFDNGLEKVSVDGINVIYIPTGAPKILRGLLFIISALYYSMLSTGLVFIHYFEFCGILPYVVNSNRLVLDIRTLAVHGDESYRKKYDSSLRRSCRKYKNITVISEGVFERLQLAHVSKKIIKLGADSISQVDKNFDDLKLIYVGTLSNRNIFETIIGFKKFTDTFPDVNIKYDIIGSGLDFEFIQGQLYKLNLQDKVTMHGTILHSNLKIFFDKCNVGVSYIPITEFFNFQPPTKTYEYIMSGIPCIATNTYENKKIISEVNGYLCNDDPDGFFEALIYMHNNLNKFKSESIKSSINGCTWSEIVNLDLKPFLDDVYSNSILKKKN